MTQAKLFLAGMLILLAAIIGNAILGVKNYNSVSAQNQKIAGLALNAHHLAKQNQQSLAEQKAQTAIRRAQNKRTLARLSAQARSLADQSAANHSLTLQVGALAEQRTADNANAIAVQQTLSSELAHEVSTVRFEQASLRAAQKQVATNQRRIVALQASEHHQSLEAQYFTCTQINGIDTAFTESIDLAFPPSETKPSTEKILQQILAKFKPRVCVKP